MATKKKLLQAAAGAAGGETLNVEDVFSTYLYEGTGATQTITNDIDLDGEGGLIFFKDRDAVSSWAAFDTERGVQARLIPNQTSDEYIANGTTIDFLSAFNSDGFTLGSHLTANANGDSFASWTFRKAPKFFTCLTYTGDGVAGRTVSHDLGSVPGAIIVKRTDSNSDWSVYHTSLGATKRLRLNSNSTPQTANTYWNYDSPTSTEFTVGTHSSINASGGTYVAYLFADNDGDGEFGPDGDADIIKCGSYTGNGSNDGPEIDLGFEAQFVITKNTSQLANWNFYDSMRGMGVGVEGGYLDPNTSDAEGSNQRLAAQPTGFKLQSSSTEVNSSGDDFIYIAIRRGPMAVPESATDVFAIDTRGGTSPTPPAFYSGFPVDLQVWRSSVSGSNNWETRDRLRGPYGRLNLNLTSAEDNNGGNEFFFDQMLGQGSATGTNTSRYSWMWRRAPNFFDAVAYTGNGAVGRTVSHNLGVAPEMMWIKDRDGTNDWYVYSSSTFGDDGSDLLRINSSSGAVTSNILLNNTAPTSTVFTLADYNATNGSGRDYIAYLFASLEGVSKLGSYTGNGSSQTIDCGFSSGASFVLIKRTDDSSSWYVWDTKRGIVSGNDPYLRLESTGAQVTSTDWIDPDSSGFTVNSTTINASSASYIFYAIA